MGAVESLDVQDLWDVAREGSDRCLRSSNPRYGFEALVVRMATREPMKDIGALVGGLLQQGNGGLGREVQSVSGQTNDAVRLQRSSEPETSSQVARQVPVGTAVNVSDVNKMATHSGGQGNATSDWPSFLAFVGRNGGRILFENVKRLNIKRFGGGILEASAPQFSVTSLEREKAKLQQLLRTFSGADQSTPDWKLLFQVGEESKGDSVAGQPGLQKKIEVEVLEEHPALKSLQKVFPGSKVEKVKGKNV